MHTPSQRLENALRKQGWKYIAGVDEAGRGAWAGPLVAAAVILPERVRLPGVRDSKLLTERQRERCYDRIIRVAVAWNVAVLHVEHIDLHGLHPTNLEAMRQAVAGLAVRPHRVLSDCFDLNQFGIPCVPVVHGDALVTVIAASSILAKVTRDRLMVGYAQDFPHYGFAQHKGYGTAEHQERLAQFGVSPLHRRSFAPIKSMAG